MKVKMFTHTDLDGVGCAILGKIKYSNIDIEYCNYNTINTKVKEYIDNLDYTDYDKAFITDLSVSSEVAELIDSKLGKHFVLLDHHPTAEFLNQYDWCNIQVENEHGACSGTSLLYDYIKSCRLDKDNIKDFVDTVRQYDTWEWYMRNYEIPKKWNDLLYLYGRDRFIDKVVKLLSSDSQFNLDKTDLLLLELNEEQKEAYFEEKEDELIVMYTKGFKVGVVFAERYISELGNYLAKQNEDLDFIALIGSKGISYRGIHADINLGEFAKQLGGGGHLLASGSPIDKDKQIKYIESLFN